MWMSLAPFWIADMSSRFDEPDDRRFAALALERGEVDLLEVLEHLDVVVGRSSEVSSSAMVTMLERGELLEMSSPVAAAVARAARRPGRCSSARSRRITVVSDATTGSTL